MKRTKRILSLLLSLCLVLGLFPSTAFAASGNLPFTDVNSSDWYYDAVQYAYEKGMMSGTSTTTFSPNDTTTRGMIVTILHRLEGTPAAAGTAFTDVPTGQWYSDSVSWASANGIVDGYGGGRFGPGDPITREQMAAILNRYSTHKGYAAGTIGSIAGFTDAAQVSSYAAEPMAWAIGNGLISGTGNNMLAPKGNATRAQVATILMRFCENVAGKSGNTPAPDTTETPVSKTYTVTFDLNYGSDTRYDVKTVKEGETVSKPSNPSRSGYSFSGWYAEKSGGRQFDFETGITSDLTLYAHWSSNSSSGGGGDSGGGGYIPPVTTYYTVTFYMNDGTDAVHTTTTVATGNSVSAPAQPVRDGYSFDGWYTDAAAATAYSFGVAVTGNLALYAKWSKQSEIGGDIEIPVDRSVSFEQFTADKYDVLVGLETDVTFYAEVSSQFYLLDSDIFVYSSDNERIIATLKDDGIGADETADDGIFTGSAKMYSLERTAQNYYAAYNGVKSSSIEIYYYTEITEEEYNQCSAIINTIAQLQSVEEVLAYLSDCNLVENYAASDEGLTVLYRLTPGITVIWEKPNVNLPEDILQRPKVTAIGNQELVAEVSNDVAYLADSEPVPLADYLPANSKTDVCVVRPFRHNGFEYDDFLTTGQHVSNALGSTVRTFDDSNADLDIFKSFSRYGLVLIDSHGTRSDVTNASWTIFSKDPYMLTGETFGGWQSFTSADWQSERIVVVSTTDLFGGFMGGGIVAVGGKFFDTYYSNNSLNDTAFFLGTCYSMYNNTIADALLRKGAEVVYGYSDVVSVGYCNNTLSELVENQLLSRGTSAQEAFDRTKQIHGTFDPRNSQTEFRMCGNGNYRLVQIAGTIAGTVVSYESGQPITNAKIQLIDEDGNSRKISVDGNGNFSRSLPTGTYTIKVSAYGYLTETIYNVAVAAGRITYLEQSVMLHPIGNTKISGTITNARTGAAVPGATVRFRVNHNNFYENLLEYITGNVVTISANENGYYEFDKLPQGYYTMEVSCDGFITAYRNIVATQNSVDQNVNLTPTINAEDGIYTIVLRWGEHPRDLDSHVVGSLSGGNSFHVYFSHKSQYDGSTEVCNLDVDDTTSYGPETITLCPMNNQPYYYYIHKYAGESDIAHSSAHIEVYNENGLVDSFNAPTNQGDGRYWNVFAIVDGQIVIKNTITDNADITYAGAAGIMTLDLSEMEDKESVPSSDEDFTGTELDEDSGSEITFILADAQADAKAVINEYEATKVAALTGQDAIDAAAAKSVAETAIDDAIDQVSIDEAVIAYKAAIDALIAAYEDLGTDDSQTNDWHWVATIYQKPYFQMKRML